MSAVPARLGMLSIGGFLEQAGISVRVLDLEFFHDDLAKIIQDEKPLIVGIGGTSTTRFEAFKIAKIIKNSNPHIITVYGGSHATFTARDTLEHVPDFDLIVRGEAELTMLELFQHYNTGVNELSKIDGISYRVDGMIVHNAPRQRISDLDRLPMLARHLVNEKDYKLKLGIYMMM